MPQQISQTALQAIFAEETGSVFLAILRITHPDLATPIRVVHDQQDLVRTDGTYLAFPFEISLPTDTEENIPKVGITIGNVDRTILSSIRGLTSAPTIELEVVLAESPNTTELGPFTFKLDQISYDAQTITGELGLKQDLLNEGWPALSFTPNTAPGMF